MVENREWCQDSIELFKEDNSEFLNVICKHTNKILLIVVRIINNIRYDIDNVFGFFKITLVVFTTTSKKLHSLVYCSLFDIKPTEV